MVKGWRAVVGNRRRSQPVCMGVDAHLSIRLLLMALCVGSSCTSTPLLSPASPRPLDAAAVEAAASSSASPMASPVVGLRPFESRMGAVDPLAATQEQNRSFEHVRLAATAPTVTIRVLNSAPQSITVLDEATGSDLYHVSSQFGPGNPHLDQGFVQVFLASLHDDASQQLVLAYGPCQRPACAGASQVMVISMNAEHGVVIEQLRLDKLVNAIAEARNDGFWVSQWNAGQNVLTRHFAWDNSEQVFVER